MSKVRYKEFYETVAEGCNGLDDMLNDWLDANPNIIVKDIKFNFGVSDNYLPMVVALVAYEVSRKEKEEESVDISSSARRHPFD